ncbi:hypothetical protein [Taibaiella chishuiensis]|uniref:Ig-like domain-containing protein n=1 Tax=Taibaiella chishuiensis TaxID=1434707 RepID=A0A2P8DCQ2_9BACT|nr:hypothetical protein [Taibaiella chishuiensis]PSK95003.1 hypothetical protein B0I18_1011167 [Taibaiella chishuiensis]
MNADKLRFERSRFLSAPPDAPLLKRNFSGVFRKATLGLLLAAGGFHSNAQCDPAGTASGNFSSLGIFLGSNVTNPSDARDGDLSTYALFWQGFGAGFLSTHTLTVNMVGNGNQTDQLYVKAELNGSIISANIFSNLSVKYYFTDGTTGTANIGSSLASWGLTIGGTTTNNGLYLDAPGKQFSKVDIAFVSPAAVSISGELVRVYEVKRVPAQPAAPAVTGSGTTISNCFSTATTYTITNPSSSLVYKWYNAGTGGTLLSTGTSYTTSATLPNGTNNVYVEAVAANNCAFPTQRISASRTTASVTVSICDSDGDGVANSADLDADNDGIPNTLEGYNASNPAASRDTDGDGIPDYLDLDSDNDGINDVREAGGTDANGDGKADGAVSANGIPASAGANGLTPIDSDGDGKPNAYDLDSDNDGISDLRESGNTALVDANNDGIVDGNVDTDKDGIIGSADGAPTTWGDASDPVLADTDGDGVPNMRDLDSDNDGITDVREAGGTDANGDGKADGAIAANGIPATAGNGLVVADSDGDGVTNEKDLDSDNDGLSDLKENNPALADANNDGKVDGTDPDGDGIVGGADGAPNTWGDANDPALLDSDSDGIPNIRDLDSDNDGVNDVREAGGTDANGDGKADGAIAANGIPATAGNGGLTPLDTDGDGVSNDKDLDSDNDGITDVRENGGTDANNDGRADGTDADGDGIMSSVDGAPNAWGDSNDPVAIDSDGDGRPDFRDLDSDNDGKSDLVESGNAAAIAGDLNNDGVIDFINNDPDGDGVLTPADGTTTWGTNSPAPVDTDGDGIPDYKDPITGTKKDIDDTPYKSKDTNGDGRITSADTGGGTDSDGDGIPDIIDADNNNFGGLGSNIGISAKAFLRGAFQGARHKDVSANWLNVLQQFATSQPYNTAAFGNYAGTESVPASTFTSSSSSEEDVVDWVLLELKKADGTLVDRHAALILENGNIVGTDKVSRVYFKALPGSYHLTVRHRNHLGLSTELITLPAAGTSFDFSTATDATLYGTSDAYTTVNGKVCLIAGNANGNGNVRYNSTANDRDAILNYLGFNEIGFIMGVYTPADVNLDGNVRYNGAANDRDFLLEMLNFNEIGFISQQIK